jgi:hypothetical protein
MPPSQSTAHGQAQVWLLDREGLSLGGSWMPSSLESRNPGDVCSCSLADVLHRAEDGELPTRYFLSNKALTGILRRAKRRWKTMTPKRSRLLSRLTASVEAKTTST